MSKKALFIKKQESIQTSYTTKILYLGEDNTLVNTSYPLVGNSFTWRLLSENIPSEGTHTIDEDTSINFSTSVPQPNPFDINIQKFICGLQSNTSSIYPEIQVRERLNIEVPPIHDEVEFTLSSPKNYWTGNNRQLGYKLYEVNNNITTLLTTIQLGFAPTFTINKNIGSTYYIKAYGDTLKDGMKYDFLKDEELIIDLIVQDKPVTQYYDHKESMYLSEYYFAAILQINQTIFVRGKSFIFKSLEGLNYSITFMLGTTPTTHTGTIPASGIVTLTTPISILNTNRCKVSEFIINGEHQILEGMYERTIFKIISATSKKEAYYEYTPIGTVDMDETKYDRPFSRSLFSNHVVTAINKLTLVVSDNDGDIIDNREAWNVSDLGKYLTGYITTSASYINPPCTQKVTGTVFSGDAVAVFDASFPCS